MGQGGPDRLGPAHVVLRRRSIERVQFISGQPHGHHLHRLGATAWTSTAATLQFLDVVARFCLVGSHQMRTMVWRDLDFERYEEPDWDDHWAVGTELARTGWCWRLNCVNVYREQPHDQGLYWGIRLSDPSRPDPADDPSAPVWKLDLWTGEHDAFAAGFLHGLTHELGLKEAAQQGVALAAEVISHFGARPPVR